MKYFLNGRGLGIGNFINCTPFLQALSEKWNEPINVYFDGGIVGECFKNAPFLNILDSATGSPFAHTRMYRNQLLTHKGYVMPDHEYFSKVIGKAFGVDGSNFHTYVDSIDRKQHNKTCFVNGAGAWKKDYLDKKLIDDSIFKAIQLEYNLDGFILGSLNCNKPVYGEDLRGFNIRTQLAYLKGCKALITNEGGLAHCAGAYKIPTFIMWKDTDKIKNKNPNPNAYYSYDNHLENFKDFQQLHRLNTSTM